MRKILSWVFTIIIVGICLKGCIKRDVPMVYKSHTPTLKLENINFPEENKNIEINGTDYIQSQAPIGEFGGELVISTIGEGPKTFNPCNTKDATSSSMAGLMYDGLLTTDSRTGKVIPLLAKSFDVNGCEYTIKLRKGIKWSDGTPITVDDVLYTYWEIVFKGLGNTATRDAMMIEGKLPKLYRIDNYTVKFVTPKPFAPFLRQLTYPIVPKHYFKPYSDKGDSAFNAFLSPNTPPSEIVSNGAFRLKEYVAAQRVVFERNPNYYKINLNNKQLPYLDKLIYLIVGDTNNEILKFEAKEIDILSIRGANVARYKAREANSDFTIYNLGADTGTLFLVINLNNRKNNSGKWNVPPHKQKWFRNKEFRKAIDYTIDRVGMVQNIAQGVAQPLYTAESLNSIYLNKNIKGHNKNDELALETLLNAGFELKNGILYDSEGKRVEFDLYTNAGALEREAIGVMIKQDLEDLGMKVNFKPVEFNSLVNKLSNTNDWDMAIMGLTGSPLEPHDGKNVWMSKGPLHLFNQRPQNYNIDDRFDWEKELDNIFERGALELSYKKRKPLYDRYQEIIYEEKPIIYLYSPIRITAIRNKLKNIYPTSLGGLIYNLDEIYIKEENK
ncbi:MAG: ABC transporter substrate-binding protein [Cyanobacteria bacterium SIG28]|nr:ABC transporter substrate-binding protein [Cyanobacteria bacterium SIG28]